MLCGFLILVLMLSGCSKKQVDINVLATTDLHSIVPESMLTYVDNERKKDKNLTVVDAGDFFDIKDPEMNKWFFGKKFLIGDEENERLIPEREGEPPLVKNMYQLKYDAVVLGNHEFISNTKVKLDNFISYFEKYNMAVLSANTYKTNGENYTQPYIIKKLNTEVGTINLGILGLTIKEVGDSSDKSRELKDLLGYENELYMNDLIEDAKKWVPKMKEDKADIIVAVVHSGEKPKKPKNPGNRIQELAQYVEGIDAIVAGHTHKEIEQHDYKNKSNETVIVTQPGKHGECISKINFVVENKDGYWKVIDKNSSIVKFE
jgi:2',3'-cyclic-nucleotide 2'-phosphodiesterase/3'-nucleotidase